MKLNLLLVLIVSAQVAAAATAKKTPEQLRGQLKRKLQEDSSGDGGDGDAAGGDGNSSSGDGTGTAGDGTTGDGAVDSSCFSRFNNVEVQGKGMTAMDSIQVGDYVRTGNNDFSRVFSLAHLDHEFEADFLQVYAEGLEKPLEITGMHMLFASGKAIRADEVSVGDMLGESKVSDIKSVKRNGVYAPITESGDIVVSGIHASSYYAFLDRIPFNQHVMSHFFFAPHRLMCSYDFDLCKNEGHTNGYTNWAYWAIRIMEKSNEFIAPVQCVLAALALPFLSAAYGSEQMLIAPFTTLAVIGFMVYKKKQNISKA
jgi:hypothetical protein